jgi:hypothetical protein
VRSVDCFNLGASIRKAPRQIANLSDECLIVITPPNLYRVAIYHMIFHCHLLFNDNAVLIDQRKHLLHLIYFSLAVLWLKIDDLNYSLSSVDVMISSNSYERKSGSFYKPLKFGK